MTRTASFPSVGIWRLTLGKESAPEHSSHTHVIYERETQLDVADTTNAPQTPMDKGLHTRVTLTSAGNTDVSNDVRDATTAEALVSEYSVDDVERDQVVEASISAIEAHSRHVFIPGANGVNGLNVARMEADPLSALARPHPGASGWTHDGKVCLRCYRIDIVRQCDFVCADCFRQEGV